MSVETKLDLKPDALVAADALSAIGEVRVVATVTLAQVVADSFLRPLLLKRLLQSTPYVAANFSADYRQVAARLRLFTGGEFQPRPWPTRGDL